MIADLKLVPIVGDKLSISEEDFEEVGKPLKGRFYSLEFYVSKREVKALQLNNNLPDCTIYLECRGIENFA